MAPDPMRFARVTGLGPRFLALLTQKRHARKMAAARLPRYGPSRIEALSGAWLEMLRVAGYASIGLLIAVALIVAFLPNAPGRSISGCPNTSGQLNAYEYELQHRRCEVIRSGALERLEQR